MHSSRMCTGRSLTVCRSLLLVRRWGCLCSRGRGYIPACNGADPSSPVDRITDMSKNITLATTLLQPVSMHSSRTISCSIQKGDVCLGVSAQLGVCLVGCLPWRCVSQHAMGQTPPPANRITDWCKNITLP